MTAWPNPGRPPRRSGVSVAPSCCLSGRRGSVVRRVAHRLDWKVLDDRIPRVMLLHGPADARAPARTGGADGIPGRESVRSGTAEARTPVATLAERCATMHYRLTQNSRRRARVRCSLPEWAPTRKRSLMGLLTTHGMASLAWETSEPGASRLKHNERSVQRLLLPFRGLHDAYRQGAPSPSGEADQGHPRGLAVRSENELPEVLVLGEKYAPFPDRKSNHLVVGCARTARRLPGRRSRPSAAPGQPRSRSSRPRRT
jgi:hypothetical protein